jgi:YfiH family protein
VEGHKKLMHQLPKLNEAGGSVHGFSSVSDGNMSFLWGAEKEILKNRKGFLEQLNANPQKCAVMSILDENRIVSIEPGAKIGIEKDDRIPVDALVTAQKNIFLFLLIADCLPVILYEPKVGVLTLAHCGWKSTNAGLLGRTIGFLKKEFNINPNNLVVGIGPGIHKESYKYADPPQRKLPGWENFLTDLPDGETAIDIVRYNKFQLIEAGVKEKNINISDVDTATDLNFFSHYRSKKAGEPEGRFAAVIGMV